MPELENWSLVTPNSFKPNTGMYHPGTWVGNMACHRFILSLFLHQDGSESLRGINMGQDMVLTSSMMLLGPTILPSDREVRAERLREMLLCVGGSNAQSLKDARNSQVALPRAAEADHRKGFREASVTLPGRAGGGGRPARDGHVYKLKGCL